MANDSLPQIPDTTMLFSCLLDFMLLMLPLLFYLSLCNCKAFNHHHNQAALSSSSRLHCQSLLNHNSTIILQAHNQSKQFMASASSPPPLPFKLHPSPLLLDTQFTNPDRRASSPNPLPSSFLKSPSLSSSYHHIYYSSSPELRQSMPNPIWASTEHHRRRRELSNCSSARCRNITAASHLHQSSHCFAGFPINPEPVL